MKKELEFQEEHYNNFKQQIKKFTELLASAVTELEKQGVTGYNCEKLKNGSFLQVFEEYHKKQQLKSQITKNMLYEKFLDLYGYDIVELQKLQNSYLSYLNRDYSFYPINNSFYSYCKAFYKQNPTLKPFIEKAPTMSIYKVFDFVSIKGNDIKISIPKELFTIYATNQKQLDTIKDVSIFISKARRLKLSHSSICDLLKNYLTESPKAFFSNKKQGLDKDMETINFDYNKILKIQ